MFETNRQIRGRANSIIMHFQSKKWQISKLMICYGKIWLWLIGFALVYCVGVNERENHKSRDKMFQSKIHYLMSMKEYIVSIEKSMEFYLRLWSSIFVYGVLSWSMEFYLCLWSYIFVCGVLSLYAVVRCTESETQSRQ